MLEFTMVEWTALRSQFVILENGRCNPATDPSRIKKGETDRFPGNIKVGEEVEFVWLLPTSYPMVHEL